MKRTSIVLSMILLLSACTIEITIPTVEPTKQGWRARCGPLPETFQESDLVGTWEVTREAGPLWHTIVLREDRTYKQMYQKPSGERYTSPWNRWYVEHRPSGGVYVHLEGMHYWYNDPLPLGGGGNWLFWDYCEDRVLEMKGEVILAVVESVEPDPLYGAAPRGIILLQMSADPDSIIPHFRLQE